MRRIILGCSLWIAVAGIAWSAEKSALRFLDDRGEKIASALEICFQVDLRTDCVEAGAGDQVIPPARFQGLRVEGPDHGPASFRFEELQPGEDGLRIPRKALLQIAKMPEEPLTVSVYDPHIKAFEKPVATVPVTGPDGVKIPAGELLVSLSSGRHAPDLHLLKVQPGDVARVEYMPRTGWSLVVRCLGSKDGKALTASTVSLESIQGYGVPNQTVGEKKTGMDGLALFPGLAGRTVDAGVKHSEYLSRKVQGLSAAPGSLAFRDVLLEEGGRIQATVLVNGQPQEGVRCLIINPKIDRASQRLYDGTTNRQGICRSPQLAAGYYLLLAALPEKRGNLSRKVAVTNGSEIAEELAFSEIRISGKVSRGGDPVPGFTIRAGELNQDVGMLMFVGEGKSGEDGRYEILVWKPGKYEIALYSTPESPMPLIEKSILLQVGEEPDSVDFTLKSTAVRGRVVDQEGKPIEKAVVFLRWSGAGERPAFTNEKGEFEFLLEDKGSGDIKARKPGYRESQSQDIALEDETELPSMTLVLAKEKMFRGTLSSAAGVPVPGGWVAAVRSYYGDEPVYPREGRTDAEGRFEVAPVGEGRNRLFASGPDCPLSFFESSNEAGDLALRCQGQPATLDLTLTDLEGRPVPETEVILRRGGVIVPASVLSQHLSLIGVRSVTDASGRLVIPNLAPGSYDVFLAKLGAEGMIESGSRTGYLTSVRLVPLNATELKLTVASRPTVSGF